MPVQERELFREYLAKVCEQIRWKKAHKVVRRELGDHLEDETALLIESGATVEEAARGAVRDMGDALLIGSQLDRSYRPRPAWGVIAITAALMVIGFFARDYVIRNVANSNHTVDVPRSLFFMGAAVLALIVGYFLDYTFAARRPLILGAGFVALTAALPFLHGDFIYSYGITYNFYYYGVYLVVFIPVVFAVMLWWWPYKGYGGLISYYLAMAVMALAWAVCGGFPVVAVNFCVCGLMLTIELLKGRFNVRKSRGLLILYSPVAAFLLWLISNYYIGRRLSLIFNPALDPRGEGYLGIQIRKILANAKWLGHGGYTMDYLPGAVDDLMLVFYIHKFGWISLVAVLVMFGALFAFAAIRIRRQKSKLGRMAASAILAALGLQFAFYVLNNIWSPLFGTFVLPLLSWSNFALVIDSFLIGLMLSVFRTNDIARDAAVEPKEIPRFKITFERVK
jgi:cell division protein FtsW (lipid II flippase)